MSIELAPGCKDEFCIYPAGVFVMGSNRGYSDYSPAHKQVAKERTRTAEIVVSNEQFRTTFRNITTVLHPPIMVQ